MSLDVYLEQKNHVISDSGSKIFIRENGSTKEISREEWDKRYPGVEPVTYNTESNYVYSANITHNLNKMADEAGLYYPLWRPEEINIFEAKELIEPLTKGLNLLKSDPERFKKFNPENGWGNYEGLVEFVENYLNACIDFPDSKVSVWR